LDPLGVDNDWISFNLLFDGSIGPTWCLITFGFPLIYCSMDLLDPLGVCLRLDLFFFDFWFVYFDPSSGKRYGNRIIRITPENTENKRLET
jgi:hypothetical protein